MAGAMAHHWGQSDELLLTVGLCCPCTGVPVMISLRLWRGIGQRLHAASRLEREYEVSWQAGRTVLIAQGTGSGLIGAMLDGLEEDHRAGMPAKQHSAINARWHTRLGVSTARDLGLAASGLVRGAEVVGALTRQAEATMAPIHCLALNHREAVELPLAA